MRRFISLALLAGVPLGLLVLLMSPMSGKGPTFALAAGAFFGLALAGALVVTQRHLQRHFKKDPPIIDGKDGEEVLFQGPANHFRGIEGVGGWLVLTDQRLLFKPHGMNIQREDWSLPLSDLIRIEPKRTLWVLQNGLRAVTASGEERFVVEERARWIREVEHAKSGGSEA